MNSSNLAWREEGRKTVFKGPVFTVDETLCRSPEGKLWTYTVLNAASWVIVIPVLLSASGEREFVMVRQWRHGARALSLEFPGGVIEPGEAPEAGAGRELLEETGFKAGKLTKLGEFNPNPAIMSNKVYVFLAEQLQAQESQSLDADEYVAVERAPEREVIKNIGRPPYIHGLMGAALSLYLSLQTT